MIRIVLFILVLLILVGSVLVWLRVSRIQHDPRHALFQAGVAPSFLPDGFWPGTWAGGGTDWLGKQFDAATSMGMNVFKASPKPIRRIPFRMVVAPSFKNSQQTVLLLDYNVSGNSPLVRLVRDEIVSTAPGMLLGILYIQLGPISIPVDYFEQHSLSAAEQ